MIHHIENVHGGAGDAVSKLYDHPNIVRATCFPLRAEYDITSGRRREFCSPSYNYLPWMFTL